MSDQYQRAERLLGVDASDDLQQYSHAPPWHVVPLVLDVTPAFVD
jgi:hypothetical protein